MFCANCGNKIDQDAKFCGECRSSVDYMSIPISNASSKKHQKLVKLISIFLTVIVVILLFGYLVHHERQSKQEAKNIILDSINNTNNSSPKNSNYIIAFRKLFDQIRTSNKSLVDLDNQVRNSDLLQPPSFTTIPRIDSYIVLLNEYVKGIEKSESDYLYLKDNLKSILAGSNLAEEELQRIIEGFNRSVNDPGLNTLRGKRNESLIVWANSVKNLYEFVRNNFNDLDVIKDENGKDQIYFSKDINTENYNKLVDNLNLKREEFVQNDKEFMEYANNKLKNTGIDMSAGELQGLIYK